MMKVEKDWSRHRHPSALLTVLVVGTVLRLYALGRESYWTDELYSIADALRFSSVELITVLPVLKNHTPVYYLLLRHWAHVVGLSEPALRLPSVLAGIGTIYGVYLVGTELFDERTGIVAAGMVALSEFHIDHSQEVRMYSFVALFTAWSFYWLLRLRLRYDRRTGAAYVLTTALLVYTHPYGLFMIVAQNCFIGWTLLRRQSVSSSSANTGFGDETLRRWGRVQVALGILLLPYMLVAVQKIVSTAAGTYTPLVWRSPPGPTRLIETLVRYFGAPSDPLLLVLVLPLLVIALGLVIARIDETGVDRLRDRFAIRPADSDGVVLTLCWLIVPIAIPAVLSHLLSPVYGIRYTIGASLGVFLLVARAITRVQPRHLRYIIVAVLLVGLVGPLPSYYDQTENEQWREATTQAAEAAESGDLVLFTDHDGRSAWEIYASRSDLVVREVATDSDWEAINGTLTKFETIWVINRTYSATNNNRAASSVLSGSHEQTADRQFVGIELYRFERRGARPAGELSTRPGTIERAKHISQTSEGRTHRLAKRHLRLREPRFRRR